MIRYFVIYDSFFICYFDGYEGVVICFVMYLGIDNFIFCSFDNMVRLWNI